MAKISIIVALANNYTIGKDNDLLCHIPGDLKRFKALTIHHSVIMGKNTYDSLPNGPLKDRNNIVLSRNTNTKIEGCIVAHSLKEAIDITKDEDEVFIIGGGSIYEQSLAIADKLYLTWINKEIDGDTFFPTVDFNLWREIEREDHPISDNCSFSFSYVNYERV